MSEDELTPNQGLQITGFAPAMEITPGSPEHSERLGAK
jgi:hypothetical protein